LKKKNNSLIVERTIKMKSNFHSQESEEYLSGIKGLIDTMKTKFPEVSIGQSRGLSRKSGGMSLPRGKYRSIYPGPRL